MSTAVQLRRGTTAQHAGFTGAVGEVTVDTDKDTVVVHDGATAGGHPLAKDATIGARKASAVAGTVDAITATFSPAFASLAATAGYVLAIPLAGANTSTTPSLAVDGFAAKTIVKGSNVALAAGDIPGADFVGLFVYDASLDKFQLLNPYNEASGLPAGSVIYVAQNSAPTGFLKANGAAISRTTYANLFAAIGTTFGVGNGTTTFNIPDLRGEFMRGWDDARGIDSGRVFGSSQTDAMQGHFHYLRRGGNLNGGTGKTFSSVGNSVIGQNLEDADGIAQNPLTDGTNGTPRTAAETRPRNLAMLACIKY